MVVGSLGTRCNVGELLSPFIIAIVRGHCELRLVANLDCQCSWFWFVEDEQRNWEKESESMVLEEEFVDIGIVLDSGECRGE